MASTERASTETARPGARRGAPPAPAPVGFKPNDLGLMVGLPLSLLLSWTTPEALWRWIGRRFAPVAARLLAADRREAVARIRARAGAHPLPRTPEEIAERLVADHIEENLQLLRVYRPGGWHPDIAFVGREHIEAALARGHGAVIWIGHFAFSSLVSKMALFQAGYAVSHLSHPRHGFSDSRFGMRWLNPIRRAAEDRFLGERVMMGQTDTVLAMRTLQKRLRGNGVISVMVRERARHPAVLPFLGGEIRIATGAPDMAYATRAALLPAFLIRTGPGAFTMTVEPPLELSDRLPRQEAVAAILPSYVKLLESYVLRHPELWRGWTV